MSCLTQHPVTVAPVFMGVQKELTPAQLADLATRMELLISELKQAVP